MTKHIIFLLAAAAVALLWSGEVSAASYSLSSPDKALELTVTTGSATTWQVSRSGQPILQQSAISLSTVDARGRELVMGHKSDKAKAAYKSVDAAISSPFYKKAQVSDVYNQLTISLPGYQIVFRAYNDAVCYRFVLNQKGQLTIADEQVEFVFPADVKAHVPYVNDNRGGERYSFSFESLYDEVSLSQMYVDSIAITPLAVSYADQLRAVVMEADLHDYPGMFVRKGETPNSLVSEFAPVVTDEVIGGHNRLNLVASKRADYIARVEGRRSLPWRVLLVTDSDLKLIDNDMAYRLASPCALSDASWIKPGKVAWDWWNALGLSGVDFAVGVNTATYKAYIDFAAEQHLDYIIVDEGWSSEESLLEPIADLDIQALVQYGMQKNVRVILWASWRNTIKDMTRIFSHYSAMGIAGFKIDFFDRDDQACVLSMEQIAAEAARHHLLVDYHGAKPFGLQRMYPNIVNFEGVKGLENCKWEPQGADGRPVHDFPRYDVSAPFLRMLCGPMDYTPGAMDNASPWNFRGINDNPMSQGTRVHQMAMYTV